MASETFTFSVNGGTVTGIQRRKIRDRAAQRRIHKVLMDAGIDEQTAYEFSLVVAYTMSVEGDLWVPPDIHAADTTLLKAYEEYAGLDTDVMDVWAAALVTATPEVKPSDEASQKKATTPGSG